MTTQKSHAPRILINAGLATLAQVRFLWPQRGLKLVAVTGTDGKTTTVQMLSAILRKSGQNVGSISTVGASINGRMLELPPHVSTPGPWQLYYLLALMRKENVKTVIIELTSHGLDQRRTFGLRFDVGIMTNISPEHLDYHGSLASYAAAKARLCQLSQVMILNHDDRMVAPMASISKRWKMFGMDDSAAIWAEDIEMKSGGTKFNLHIEQQRQAVTMSMVGRYNVLNALAAAGAASELGLNLDDIAIGLAELDTVLGRWQVVQESPFMIVVDFGHTPQAFSQVLPLARAYVGQNGRLIHVFGSAGSRDAGKRAEMGRLSAELADISVVTMEDPRNESLDQIQQQIIEGLRAVRTKEKEWQRIDSRSDAISWAVQQARPGDVVLLTGKGHERTMNIAGEEVPWDEVAAVQKALGQLNTAPQQ